MNVIQKLLKEKVHCVIRVADPERVVEIATALNKGGINTVEIIIQNPEIVDVIHYLNSTENLTIMAGGIITQRQAQTAINAGASVIVSPVFQMNLVRICQSHRLPLIMTATTPNEAYSAWKARTPLIKIFPTKPMGGAIYIEDMLRPMPFLNVIATGNIELNEAADYLRVGAKAVGIGRALYKNADAKEIEERAARLIESVKDC
ncbi:MAG: bifunctional 4-hydroxy-2-oxoglutarate aldolase/2-dehydro-3-deoxy-phosphogluconate aldolase [Candidatus Gastranaerophilales bacterium]|nr:bifunctional 4-hydroxy-2-oxoglutarate aldolase/2-dehydro-3-deoxy-phosphogluconate aldolase [Candidatus Gastranaerophilales bacterium]